MDKTPTDHSSRSARPVADAGMPNSNSPLNRAQADELARRECLPTPAEIEAMIPPEGIAIEELYNTFRGRRGGETVSTANVKGLERGSSSDFLKIISSVAKLEEASQLMVKKEATSPPCLLPDDTFPEDDQYIENDLEIKIQWRDQTFTLFASREDTIEDLVRQLSDQEGFDFERTQLLIKPRMKLYKFPFENAPVLEDVIKDNVAFKLIASTPTEIRQSQRLAATSALSTLGLRGGAVKLKSAAPSRSRNWKQVQAESKYTFHDIQPLPYLPNPEKSHRFLKRLADDPGIKTAMQKHQLAVGVLTEMNPAEHTTHESRTLGLNRNHGEVIELRLRTDRYDGYRDYRVIRKTLCHELSHNLHGDHDSAFWALTKQLEQEVERNDWKHGGHALSKDEFYDPNDDVADADHADSGGWTGGAFVLGSAEDSRTNEGLARREILAKAAMSRLQKQRKKAPEDKEQS